MLVGNKLDPPPSGWSLMNEIPETEILLQMWNAEADKHIYQLPIIDSLQDLSTKWSPLSNDLHTDAEFDKQLTGVEREYEQLARDNNNNPRVKWDPSGDWSGKVVQSGTGVVGLGADGNTIILGFTNLNN